MGIALLKSYRAARLYWSRSILCTAIVQAALFSLLLLLVPVEAFAAVPILGAPTSASVTATAATLGGNVTDDGGNAITGRGVVYSATATNAAPQIDGTGVTEVTHTGTTGVFTVDVSGLTADTGYSYAAYAINSAGTSYSSVGTFVTPPSNTHPSLSGLSTTLAASEGVTTLIDGDVTFADAEGNFTGGTVSVSGLVAGDIVSVQNTGSGAGQIGFDSGTGAASYEGTPIGTLSGGAGATATITLNASATSLAVDTLIQALSFTTNADVPTTSRTLTLGVADAAGAALTFLPTIADRYGTVDDPFKIFSGQPYAAPAFTDVDGDGDIDAFIGRQDGTLAYFKNTGTATSPTMTSMTGSDHPLNGVAVGSFATPALVDIDGDADPDAFIGRDGGDLVFYRNDGSASSPAFTSVTGAGNPFNGVDVGSRSAPGFADLDVDGDIDAFIGRLDGTIAYYRNTGTAGSPVFTAVTDAGNPFNGVDVGGDSAPAFVDLDSDGDLDALVGNGDGRVNFYRNDGTSKNPSLTARTGTDNPFNQVGVAYSSKIGVVNIDGSGAPEIFAGSGASEFKLFKATGASPYNVAVTVTAVNDAPTLTTVSTLSGATEDTAYTITYAALAAAADEADVDSATLSFRVEAVSTGTLTKNSVAVTAGATLLSTGESLMWTPAANANGTLNAFTIKAWDGALASSSAVQVQVTVAAVNDLPAVTSPTSASVTATSATLGGNVTADGGLTLTERGVVYAVTATNAAPQIGGTGVTKVAATGTTGVFTVAVTGLASDTAYSYAAYATNSDGSAYSSTGTFTTGALSTTADLSALVLSVGTLAPTFASGTTSYAASVSGATTGLTLTPTVSESNATVKVNNVSVTSGNASNTISLDLGDNTITTLVTAQDGTTTRTYTVVVTRAVDYAITTSGGALVITDLSGNGETIALSQSGANLVVTVAGRSFTVDGASSGTGSASIALAGLTSITLNAGAGNDTINIGAFTATLPSLTLNGDTGDDTVNLNGDLTFASNASLDLNLQNDHATPGIDTVNVAASANILGSGTGTITLKASRNVSLATGSSLETVNGGITVEANQQTTATGGSFIGVSLANAAITTAGTGVVTVKGRGGNSGTAQSGVAVTSGGRISGGTVTVNGTGGAGAGNSNGVSIEGTGTKITSGSGTISITGQASSSSTGNYNVGILVSSGGQVTSTGTGAGAATITLDGTGGGGAEGNVGVKIYQTDSAVSSIDGAIAITGHGGASASGTANNGILVLDAGRVSSTGTGSDAATITMTGTGGGGTQYAHGIEIYLNDARVTSVAGNMSLTGQGGGASTSNYNTGILVWDTAYVRSTGTGAHAATVTLTGTGGNGTGDNYGLDLESTSGVVSSVDGAVRLNGTAGAGGLANASYAATFGYSGNTNPVSVVTTGTASIEVVADSVRILDTLATINAGNNTVTLKPKTAGTLIDLGGTDSATTLGLTDAELDRITAGTLVVGDNQSGNLTVSAAISRSAATAVSLRSGGTLTFDAALDAAGGNVTVSATITAGGTATVTSPTSASITTSGATLGGNLTAVGALAVTERGVVYAVTSANAAPRIGGTGVTRVTGSGTATGVFTVAVSGLASGTAYSYAAYATNGAGTAYSSVGSFTTAALPPEPSPEPNPPPAPPQTENRFNPGGIRTATNLEPETGVQPTRAPSDIVTNLDRLDSRVGVSDNGVVVVLDNGLPEPVRFRANPPDNVLIAMPSQKPLDVEMNGNTLHIEIDPETPNPPRQTILGTTTLLLPDGTQAKGLQLVQGEAAIGNAVPGSTLGGLELSKDETLRGLVAQAGGAGGTAGFSKALDGSGSVSAESGEVRIVVRLMGSGTSTLSRVVRADGTVASFYPVTTETITLTLRAGEVARFNALGELDGVFLGSLSGTVGKTGDTLLLERPEGVVSFPATTLVFEGGNVPGRLGMRFSEFMNERLAGLLQFDQRADGLMEVSSGVLKYYARAIVGFEVVPDSPDGFTANADGSLSLTYGGIRSNWQPILENAADFADYLAVSGGFRTEILDNGLVQVSGGNLLGRRFLVGRPRYLLRSDVGAAPRKLTPVSSGKASLFYTNSQGLAQQLDPAFHDEAQVRAAAAALGWTLTRRGYDNNELLVTSPTGEVHQVNPDFSVDVLDPGTELRGVLRREGERLYFYYNDEPLRQGFTLE